MPKILRSLDDHTQETLAARKQGQAGKFQPVPDGTERVADVVLESCSRVAKAFEPLGFRWAKSRLRFSQKVGPFTHTVSFQADSENVSGGHIGVSMHAQVESSALEKWRIENGVTSLANIWISQVGYLSPDHVYLKWDLLDPKLRNMEIESMISTVHHLVIPAFEVCSSTQSLIGGMMERREITWIADRAIDVALWTGNKVAAEQLLANFMATKPRLVSPFLLEYERQKIDPEPTKPTDYLAILAWVCHRHDLAI